jgi:hypothetical protein
MTADQRFEQDLPALLTDLAMPAVPAYRDDIVGRFDATRQRPAWTFPERWIPMDVAARRVAVAPLNWRLLTIAALLILAAVAVAIIAAGALRKPPPPPYGPAANGRMVYAARGDIFVTDPGGASQAIATGPEVDSDPRYSPDGLHIVFIRATASGPLGMVADADGQNVREIPGGPCTNCSGWTWSGDGRHLLVTSGRPGNDISVLDTITGQSTAIDVVGTVFQASFRPPDDRQIAYVKGNGDLGQTLVVMGRDGSHPRDIAVGDEIRDFDYSPDGSQIAYEARIAREDRWVVHVIGADGAGDVTLANPTNLIHQGGPQWAPDGTSLLVWRTYRDLHAPVLSILRPGGRLIRDLPYIRVGAGGWLMSPDGSSVVFWPDVAGSREMGRCPLGDASTCPAIVVRIADGTVTTLSFHPDSLSWQRTSQ